MFYSYLKIACRNLLKYRSYAFINIAGLAVGIACFSLIMLDVWDELDYDRYHPDSDQLYRVALHGRLAGNDINTANTCPPMAAALLEEFPEVEAATRLYPAFSTTLVSYGTNSFNEDRVYFADSTFFNLFGIKLLRGDGESVLKAPNSVVLTETIAQKYFGQEDPIGKTLTFDSDTDYQVTGVCQDVPTNTHFRYDLLASFNTLPRSRSTTWVSNDLYTYIVLEPGAKPTDVTSKFPALVRKYVAPQIQTATGATFDEFIANGGEYGYSIHPVKDIHLHSTLLDNPEPVSNPAYVIIFSLTAFFILILACINFMNLATARSANRAKEVGIRKAVGSQRWQLIQQFLAESIVLSFIALGVGLLLVELALPTFNTLVDKQIETAYFRSGSLLPALVLLTVFVGVLAGSYPAFFLAAFKPVEVLKGKFRTGLKSSHFRSILVVFQFVISIALILGTLVVRDQLEYIRQKELGFNKEHVVVISRASVLDDRVNAFRTELEKDPEILSTAATVHLPGGETWGNVYNPQDAPEAEGYLLRTFVVGFNLLETLGIEMAAGRSFSADFRTDSSAYIINEAAVRKFGWNLEEAVGKTIIEPDPRGPSSSKVIGVVKDFHYASLHEPIEPAMFVIGGFVRDMAVRIKGGHFQETIQNIETRWNEFVPGQPFEFSFLDQDLDKLYRADQQVGRLFTIFSALGIFVACLGLFGLSSFSMEQRTKEIGVRKVLGASVLNIFILLSKEFTRLVLIAFLVAAPFAYYAMRQWLQGFAYQSEIQPFSIALAGLLALFIALVTVSYQTIRAALANPAGSLRYE